MNNQLPADVIAAIIRRSDGNHAMGAGELGEHIADGLRAANMLREPEKCRPITNVPGNKPYCPTHQPYTGEWPCEYAEPPVIAATAAVERVRAVHVRDEYGLCVACSWEYPDASYDALSNDVAWPCPTIAALDGAPEPETAPENYEPKCNGACVVHGSPVTNWPVQYGRRNRETGALHWLNGDPVDSWWHENQDSYEHVKRYTSPPLPVEGESN